jgi:holo-[acyl-carrier protein] synthase
VPRRRLFVGVDIVRVDRVERVLRENSHAEDELFTPAELAYCRPKRRKYEHLAARFAAKEAVFKAFGTGVGRSMRWKEVEIARDRAGRPLVRLHGAAAAQADRQGLTVVEVSLSHTDGLAVAHAVALGGLEQGVPCAST